MERNEKRKHLLLFGIAYALLFILIIWVSNLTAVNRWIADVMLLLRPIIIGLALAYIANPFFRLFERKVFFRLRPQALRRGLSLFCTYLLMLLIIALLLVLIIPQLIESVQNFIGNYKDYVSNLIDHCNNILLWFNGVAERFTHEETTIAYLNETNITNAITDFFKNLNNGNSNIMDFFKTFNYSAVINTVGSTISIITDTIFGIFISLYLLASKEKRYAQVMKLRCAVLGEATNERITRVCTIANRSFGGFLEGKLLDSLIISILMYVVISIFGIPYPILIAVIVGITDIIPIIGPIIGTVPTAFIILLTDPGKVIPFIIIVIAVQQIDGNIISPKILGDNTGVSSLCVMIAITTMGSLWGFAGMLLGVPLFATILELTDNFVEKKLQAKGLPAGTENYYAPDSAVDPAGKDAENSGKTMRRFQKKVLHLKKEEATGGNLSNRQKFQLKLYSVADRLHLFTEMSEDTLTRFAAEEAAVTAAVEAGHLFDTEKANISQPEQKQE